MQRNRAAWLIYGQHGIKLIIYACPELGQVCCLSRKLQKKKKEDKKQNTGDSSQQQSLAPDEAPLPSVVL